MAFMRSEGCLLVAILLAVTAGCGSEGPFEYVQVSGKIVYDDGSPIPFPDGTQMLFQSQTPPVNEVTHPRPGVAVLSADGTFDVITSYKYNDGLTPGKHKVLLYTLDPAVKLPIPPECLDIKTTPIEIDTADSPLEIKIAKPTGEKK